MNTQQFPFMNGDFTKIFADYKMPNMDMDAMIHAYRKNVEAMTAANQLCVEGMQTMMRRNIEIMRQNMEEISSMMNELSTEGTPEEKLSKQADRLRASLERNITSMKEMADIAAKANGEASDVVTGRMTAGIDEWKSAVKTAAKN